MGAAALGLLWRAVDLQLVHKTFLQREGDARHVRVVSSPAHRGRILDRHGEPLAVSTPVDSIWICPRTFLAERDRWGLVVSLLGLDEAALERHILARMDREFLYLQRHVPPALAERIADLSLAGIYRQREYRRYYPSGEVAAHVVGFTDVDDVGQEGLELGFDARLRGVDGSKRVIRDRLGRTVEDLEQIRAPRSGDDLVTTLDRRIQYLAHRALKSAVKRQHAKSGSMVVLDARSGEVLAMANAPAYNPNNRAERTGERFRNRAVTDLFEPGSTVKPFIVAAALETGWVMPDTRLDTSPGLFRVGRYTVRDLRDYGIIDIRTVLKKSSNVGASKLGLAMPPGRLWRLLTELGFGQPAGTHFPGEARGVLPSHHTWGEIHQATLSFGYGLSVSPLQLAQAYTAIANGGWLLPPTLTRTAERAPSRRVMSERTALEVRGMLEAVVDADGTAPRARVPGYRVAGKTGTVRKPVPGGYASDRYVSTFVGILPVSAPRLVVVITIDEPGGKEYYGGDAAAPVFADVMSATLPLLGIAPDEPELLAKRIDLSGDVLTGLPVPLTEPSFVEAAWQPGDFYRGDEQWDREP
ncbi:MAG: peptidoglycan D,D-transpeptidase FtsI family protein [Gammaproteobacteria bacterium]